MKNEICLARLKEIEVDYHKSYDEPRKDGFHVQIYDDGREVKLIKHK